MTVKSNVLLISILVVLFDYVCAWWWSTGHVWWAAIKSKKGRSGAIRSAESWNWSFNTISGSAAAAAELLMTIGVLVLAEYHDDQKVSWDRRIKWRCACGIMNVEEGGRWVFVMANLQCGRGKQREHAHDEEIGEWKKSRHRMKQNGETGRGKSI